ncbi:MAG: helix-turn-helix domain-containing protein [Oscillospiraceae bacterium]|nr:helix-turn-helix domain-containing protein [Oscillospiraceae bacterium]
MNNYVTAGAIKALREKKGLTQNQLAQILNVSDKAVSKWETAKGLPDITLIEPLAAALGVSVPELMLGEKVTNNNASANLLRAKFYVCPVCGNVIYASGDALISCCGITLPALEASEPDGEHEVKIETVEDESFITVSHSMTKQHYISFAAFATSDRIQLVKFYPEGNAETRMNLRGGGYLYVYCNRHGLMKKKVRLRRKTEE